MPFSHPVLEIIFLCAVTITWSMIAFNLVLTVGGYRYRRRFFRGDLSLVAPDRLPAVSALVPARNEAMVIEKTVRALLAMDYPKDRLEIIVVNDKSTDATAEIAERLAKEDPRVRVLTWPASQRGSGKPHALNEGLKLCRHPVIAIYDADNNPTRDSLKILCSQLVKNPALAAAMGKFRCLNRNRSWLTRMVSIETLCFQWMVQAGRYWYSNFAVLPGTNYVIRREALDAVGGWDEKAITEDSELSVRLQMRGYKVQFVPTSVTWEQEPEKLKDWVKQRARWVRGNNYVMRKFAGAALKFTNRQLSMEFLYLFGLYYLFLASIVTSHLTFILSGLGIVSLDVPGPYTAVWLSAFVLYLVEVLYVLSYEKEDSPANALTAALMYFTYCQLWIYVVFKSLYLDMTRRRVGVWDKTVRYTVDAGPSDGAAGGGHA